jgi:hypothetical protein
MSFLPVMQKGSLDAAHPDRHGKITKETVSLDGVSVTRVTFGVGASWSHDLKEYARTESYQIASCRPCAFWGASRRDG